MKREPRDRSQMGWTRRKREPDSDLGYNQDWHSQRWTTDRDRETEGRQTGDWIPEITGIRRNSQWDFPRRRALFTSVGTVREGCSTEGCFSCAEWTHNTEQCQALDESFPFLPIGWVAERSENTFILGQWPPSISPRSHQTGNQITVATCGERCAQLDDFNWFLPTDK